MSEENLNIQTPHLKGKSIDEFLNELEENLMIDDHGQAIIGDRKRKPKLPE